jgi:hypothetical protein
MYPLPPDSHVFTISFARANSSKRRLRMMVSMDYFIISGGGEILSEV